MQMHIAISVLKVCHSCFAVSWQGTTVPSLPTGRQEVARPSLSRVEPSAIATEGSSQGHCPTFSNSCRRYETQFILYDNIQKFTVDKKLTVTSYYLASK